VRYNTFAESSRVGTSQTAEKSAKPGLLAWYKARDTMLGMHRTKQDMAEGLRLAQSCRHADAVWLVSLFPEGVPATRQEAKAVFVAHANDARALYFGAFICWFDKVVKKDVRRSAELGYEPAQAWMAEQSGGHERVAWAERAAAQGERDALFCLALHCEKSRSVALIAEAAALGHAYAQCWHAKHNFESCDWRQSYWLGRAAPRIKEAAVALLDALIGECDTSGRVVFEIGAACKGCIDRGRTVFGRRFDEKRMRCAEAAVVLHDRWCDMAREAIRCWMQVARRYLVKDIRILIARLLWKERWVWAPETVANMCADAE
jgi:hypothetical protein